MHLNTSFPPMNLPYAIKRVQRRLDLGLSLLQNYSTVNNRHLLISQKISENIEDFQRIQGAVSSNPEAWIHKRVEDIQRVITEEERNQIHPFDRDSLLHLNRALVTTIRLARQTFQQQKIFTVSESLSSFYSKTVFSEEQKKEFKEFSRFANENILLPMYADIYWSLCSPYTVQEDPSPAEIEQIKDLQMQKKTCSEISKILFTCNNLWRKSCQDTIYMRGNMARWLSKELLQDIMMGQYRYRSQGNIEPITDWIDLIEVETNLSNFDNLDFSFEGHSDKKIKIEDGPPVNLRVTSRGRVVKPNSLYKKQFYG